MKEKYRIIVIDNPKCQNLLNLPNRVDAENTSLEPPKSIFVLGLLENPQIALSISFSQSETENSSCEEEKRIWGRGRLGDKKR